MIKIIKYGKKLLYKFKCDTCGCEFECNDEDFNASNTIECPCCNTTIFKYMSILTTPVSYPSSYNIPYTMHGVEYDCENCPSKPSPTKEVTVGDTPCTWCRKNQSTCNQ